MLLKPVTKHVIKMPTIKQASPKHNGSLQFRSAGPMILPDYTPSELSRVRNAVLLQGSKIKYVALCKRNDGSLLVFAQASEKIGPKTWRRSCRSRGVG
jgi:hypothetical protein